MSHDARFEEGGEAPLRLVARDTGDLEVMSALLQDAVLTAGDIEWDRRRRRLALLVNRFRWEDARPHGAEDAPERVRSLLVVEFAMAVASQGVDRHERDVVLSLLALGFQGDPLTGGELLLTLAGDGALRVRTDGLEVTLSDVTRPYRAPSGRAPSHPA